MTTKPRLLLVEDTPSIMRLYHEVLKKLDVDLLDAATGARAVEILDETIPDVVLLDVELPDTNGLDILRRIRARNLPCAVIVVTAHGSVKIAVEAMREGAYDFIIKPFPPDRLIVTVRNALERRQLQTPGRGQRIAKKGRFHDLNRRLASDARGLQRHRERCVEPRDGVHHRRKRHRQGALRRRDSSAESAPRRPVRRGQLRRDPARADGSEMFGHVKGAFTGAATNRDGRDHARREGGTLFLDEICEMDLTLQVKLLRVIQSGEFEKVGGSETEHADVRYVCATNRDPWGEVQAGRFREDLYYRLHVVPCAMPPLRERDDDLLLLARHFLPLYAMEVG